MKKLTVIISVLFSANTLCFSQWQSNKDGAFEDVSSWISTSEFELEGLDACAWNSTSFTIENDLVLDCAAPSWYGSSEVYVLNGGKLSIGHSTEIFGNTFFVIDKSSSVIIDGDLLLSGDASLLIEGNLTVKGNIVLKGNAEICGKGVSHVSGKISGKGLCKEFSFQKLKLISCALKEKDDNVMMVFQTAKIKSNSTIKVLRSVNGLTFNEVTLLDAESNSTYDYLDDSGQTGTLYYQIILLDSRERILDQCIEMINIPGRFGDACEMIITPNPCVPNCIADISSCPEGSFEATILDARGNKIAALFPIEESPGRIKYVINKGNYLAPGTYVLLGSAKNRKLSKKIIIK